MNALPLRQCRACEQWYQPIVRSGRPTEFCAERACRIAMKRAWGKQYRERIKAGYIPKEAKQRSVVVAIPAPPQAKPVAWWAAQAAEIDETCQRCEGPVVGVYVSPNRETHECAVVAHCRLCGRERVVIAGQAGIPYEDQSPGVLIPPRRGPRRMNTSRRVIVEAQEALDDDFTDQAI